MGNCKSKLKFVEIYSKEFYSLFSNLILCYLMNPVRVYIVEDEPLIRENIRICLQEAGYEVCGTANNATTALAELKELAVDIVLIDIYLKGNEDGIELANALNTLPSAQNLPFIFLTSYSDAPTLQRAKQTLPAGYIVKPFEEADLRANIEIALARHKTQGNPPKEDKKTTDHIFVKQNGELKSVQIHAIEYFKAFDNYSFIHLAAERILVRTTLKRLQETLSTSQFIRCHRAYIVNSKKITSISGSKLWIDQTPIPIGKNYRKTLLEKLHILSGDS